MTEFGYFAYPNETVPAHDPGLKVECPFCRETLSAPMMTLSLYVPGDSRSYFYRAHAKCYDSASEAKVIAVDSELVDAVVAQMTVSQGGLGPIGVN